VPWNDGGESGGWRGVAGGLDMMGAAVGGTKRSAECRA
jgi:hypothetical protein